ncbi:hypothetical protein ACFL0V_02530 [Nanoarchaeota archaeon]
MIAPGLKDNAFTGVGYGERVPIDVLPIYQLGRLSKDFTFLVVDTFVYMNGGGRPDRLLNVFDNLSKMYDCPHNILMTSEFMDTFDYELEFGRVGSALLDTGLVCELMETVPEKRRGNESSRLYPQHELACVRYLSDRYQQKVGPSKERVYDDIMQKLGFNMDFAYILPAYALGTKTADEVIHYVPESRGPNNGQRIFFDEPDYKIVRKLQQGCSEALRYFAKIAVVSGVLRGDNIEVEPVLELEGKRLKRKTIDLVLEHIVEPYREVER